MRNRIRTILGACLLLGASVSLSGCDFLDNIVCDLLSLPACDAGDLAPGFDGMGGPRVRNANSIGPATEQ